MLDMALPAQCRHATSTGWWYAMVSFAMCCIKQHALCQAAAAAAAADAGADLLSFGASEAQKAQPLAIVVVVKQADNVVHLLPAVLLGLDGHEHRVEVVHVAQLVCTQAAAESLAPLQNWKQEAGGGMLQG